MVGALATGVVYLVGSVAGYAAGRRLAFGAYLQILAAVAVVLPAGFFADTAIDRCRRDWHAFLARGRD
ncbi:hypothetical protein [Phytohabitans suffuscus]|uniref:Uncharacterized protein n=1 Tax=Phytohabitans suffuscus TaxID=624315 RepID=A0A6F8YKC3_9ACTN|nr:hypothetical protein [Phytohabitans suffuscus]BCB86562.1 hypothetical protein Psuf_038750 [Phytohabitans suffuscus]